MDRTGKRSVKYSIATIETSKKTYRCKSCDDFGGVSDV